MNDLDHHRHAITRKRLRENPEQLQDAIALFPITVAEMAKELYLWTSAKRHPIAEDEREYRKIIERNIRGIYREMFGSEMGPHPADDSRDFHQEHQNLPHVTEWCEPTPGGGSTLPKKRGYQ